MTLRDSVTPLWHLCAHQASYNSLNPSMTAEGTVVAPTCFYGLKKPDFCKNIMLFLVEHRTYFGNFSMSLCYLCVTHVSLMSSHIYIFHVIRHRRHFIDQFQSSRRGRRKGEVKYVLLGLHRRFAVKPKAKIIRTFFLSLSVDFSSFAHRRLWESASCWKLHGKKKVRLFLFSFFFFDQPVSQPASSVCSTFGL